MARLVDCYPSDDDLPDVNALLKRPADAATKTPAKARSPTKNLIPKSTVKPSTRKVRRLGDGNLNLDNPLFRRWNADEDDDVLRGSPRRSPTKSRLFSTTLQSNSTQQSISEFDDTTQFKARALRTRRPRLASELDDEDSEEPSTDLTSAHTSFNLSKIDLPAPLKAGAHKDVQTEQVRLEELVEQPESSPAPGLAPGAEPINADASAYETAGEDSTDLSHGFDSDFARDDSSADVSKMPAAKLLFGRPQQDQNLEAPATPSRNFLALQPRHPNLRTESPSEQDKSSYKLGSSKPKAFPRSRAGANENGQSTEHTKQTTTADLADALSQLRLEFRDLSGSDDDAEANTTPPSTPPGTLNTKSLVSQNKRAPIPKTPHRPSEDTFWSKDEVDGWNDQHSPRKLMLSPVMKSPTKASPTKAAKKSFEAKKHSLAEEFLGELDAQITQGKIAELAESTGGVKLVWTKTLNTTAGRANWKRETIRTKQPDGAETSVRYNHHASIELAEKVIDDEERLLNVLAHEFCHLANFMINNVTTNPHGREFKAWATKCSRAFVSRGVKVTTKHTYEIDFKYVWACGSCSAEYKRHSRSIDPQRHRCGTCKGELKQTRPVPRAGTGGPSEYQIFMKEHMKLVREENPGLQQKEVMRMVAERWSKRGADKVSKVEVGVEGEVVEEVKEQVVVAMDEEPVIAQMVDLTLDG